MENYPLNSGSMEGICILSIGLKVLSDNKSVCWDTLEYWCLKPNNPAASSQEKYIVLFEDYVAHDMKSHELNVAIAVEMDCKHNIVLLDKIIIIFAKQMAGSKSLVYAISHQNLWILADI